ncbi:MAG: hypothetical protein GXO50_09610 [Chlorobi bacterium]|nr:hypothetical protein [Chlorobiota bacterium]
MNPEIELAVINNVECLRFKFRGHFSESDAVVASEEWKEYFRESYGGKITVVWDAADMSGFDIKARSVWQHTIKELSKRIDCVWLIAESRIIRAGARMMAAFTDYCLKVVDSEKKIKG